MNVYLKLIELGSPGNLLKTANTVKNDSGNFTI